MNTNEWKLIETAPKDGTSIVGWNEEFGFKICNYLGHENYKGEFEFGWIVFSYGDTYEFRPTHWISLPELPPQK